MLRADGDVSALSRAQIERKDLQVFKDVATSVNRYTQFTIFDDVSASVKDGVVTLTGKVTMPYKRDDIEKRVAQDRRRASGARPDHGAAGVAVRRRAALSDRAVDLRQLEFLELRDHGRTRRSTSSSSTAG